MSILDDIVTEAVGSTNPPVPQGVETPQNPEQPQAEPPNLIARAAPTAIRVLSGAGAFAGPVVGAATGAGGDLLAQLVEEVSGQRKELSLGEAAGAGVVGALPFGRAAEALGATTRLGKVAAQAGGDALLGAVASELSSVGSKGELADTGDVAKTAAITGAMGAGATYAFTSPRVRDALSRLTGREGSIPKGMSPAIYSEDLDYLQTHGESHDKLIQDLEGKAAAGDNRASEVLNNLENGGDAQLGYTKKNGKFVTPESIGMPSPARPAEEIFGTQGTIPGAQEPPPPIKPGAVSRYGEVLSEGDLEASPASLGLEGRKQTPEPIQAPYDKPQITGSMKPPPTQRGGTPTEITSKAPSDSTWNRIVSRVAPWMVSADALRNFDYITTRAAGTDLKRATLQFRLQKAMEGISSRSPEEQQAFMYKYQDAPARAQADAMGAEYFTPEEKPIADVVREVTDMDFKEAKARGFDMGYIPDYLRQKFSDEGAAQEAFLQGDQATTARLNTGMLKTRRGTPQMAEQAGLTYEGKNIVEQVMNGHNDMERLFSAHDLIEKNLKQGNVRVLKPGEPPPPGATLIDEGISRALGKGTMAGPAGVVDLINRYYRPSTSPNPITNAALGAAGALRTSQVALSAYHALNTILSHTAVNLGMNVTDVAGGLVSGDIGRAGKGLVGTAKTLSGAQFLDDLWKTHQLFQDTREAALLGQGDMPAAIRQIVAGGGRLPDDVLGDKVAQGFRDALSQGNFKNLPKEALKGLLDVTSAPTMRYIVPRAKIGAYLNLLEHEVGRLNPQSAEEMTRIARTTWDHVDNVFGQLVGDNLGLSKNVQKLMNVVIGFPGWNIGSYRLLTGTARAGAKRLAGQEVDLAAQQSARFALGLTMAVGLVGSLTGYAMTGKWPEQFLDAFYPQTGGKGPDGKPIRVQLPSYMRDAFGLFGDVRKPVDVLTNVQKTIKAKQSPLLRTAEELLNNMDFYGVQISDPNAGLPKNLVDVAQYLGRQALPFSLQETNVPGVRAPESSRDIGAAKRFFGITPAPAFVGRTQSEQDIAEAAAKGAGSKGAITQEEFYRRKDRRKLREELQARDPKAGEDLQSAITKGIITPKELGKFGREGAQKPIISRFRALGLEEAIQVFRDATPQEKQQFAPWMAQKVQNAAKSGNFRALHQWQDSGLGFQ